MTAQLVKISVPREGNYQVGENNHKAKLTDSDVELLRRMHEEFPEGHAQHWGYRRLAVKFGVTKTLVRKICNYQVRTRLTPR